MVCALAMANVRQALDTHLEMSDANKKHPSTQYILYKVALRSQDTDLGSNPCRVMILITDNRFDSCSVP